MSDDMVERVAILLVQLENLYFTNSEKWGALDAEAREQWREDASTIIAAMREPTGSMIDAGALSFDLSGRSALDGQPSKCWQAMIDAALATTPEKSS